MVFKCNCRQRNVPGKHSVSLFQATVAGFRGKVDGNYQQLVFQVHDFHIFLDIQMRIFRWTASCHENSSVVS